jgi:integrase
MPQAKLTPGFVLKASLPAEGDRVIYWDAGLGLQVTVAGHKSYVVQYRAKGKSHRMALKAGLTLREARKESKAILGAVAKGGDPLTERRRRDSESRHTLKAIAEEFFAREGKELRSIDQRKRIFERLVFPVLGKSPMGDLRRSDVVRLLDKIEDESGPRQAHVTLAYLSRLFTWHASRDDDFRSPIVRGMGRIKVKERARKRFLTDAELKAVWNAARASAGPFGAYVQFLLLTGARRNEAALMSRSELSGSDWLLPEARNKTKVDFLRPLPRAAMDVLGKLPVMGNGKLFFTGNGRTPIGGLGKRLADLHKASGTSGWTLHDLRRTARTLMSRAKVPTDHAEISLGHVLQGIRANYDVFEYKDEKAAAYEALAGLVHRIVDPQVNVIALRS